jgi:hypothetical protein
LLSEDEGSIAAFVGKGWLSAGSLTSLSVFMIQYTVDFKPPFFAFIPVVFF